MNAFRTGSTIRLEAAPISGPRLLFSIIGRACLSRRVMRLRSCMFALVIIAIGGLTAFVGASSKSAAPITVSVVSVAETEETTRVAVEFLRRDAAARFAEAHLLQIRVAGKWQSARRLPGFEDGYLFARTNSQCLVVDLPGQTEACRFLLGYRVGPIPYCRAYWFLSKHGVWQKFPGISKAILECFPRQPRLRHMECELEIPAGTHNPAQALDGGIADWFDDRHHWWPAASDPRRSTGQL